MKKVLTAILFCFLAATLWGTNSFEIEKVTEDYIQIHLKIDEYNIPQTSDKPQKSVFARFGNIFCKHRGLAETAFSVRKHRDSTRRESECEHSFSAIHPSTGSFYTD